MDSVSKIIEKSYRATYGDVMDSMRGVSNSVPVPFVVSYDGSKQSFWKNIKEANFSFADKEGMKKITIKEANGGGIPLKQLVSEAKTYLKAFNSAALKNHADWSIPYDNINQIKWNIEEGTLGNNPSKRAEFMDLINLAADETSLGGKDITKEEQVKIISIFANRYYELK